MKSQCCKRVEGGDCEESFAEHGVGRFCGKAKWVIKSVIRFNVSLNLRARVGQEPRGEVEQAFGVRRPKSRA